MRRLLPRLHSSVLLLGTVLLLAGFTRAATPPPKPWPAHPFEPLSPERIAALPAPERAAWESYWQASEALAAKIPVPRGPEFSPLKPMSTTPTGGKHTQGLRLDAPAAWYGTDGARTIADRVVAWQSAAGAWEKGINYLLPKPATETGEGVWIRGTFDNDATIFELRFLARVIAAGRDAPHAPAWLGAFERGLGYVFAAQYPNGGFPQVYPLVGGYHDAITFNDDAMVHVLELLRDVAAGRADYAFVRREVGTRAAAALDRGTRCVLATQLHDAAGHPTVWCQQYDALTLQPCAARNFEPVADSSQESAGLALFLMSLKPTAEIRTAVEGAMAWFQRTAIPDHRWIRIPSERKGELAPAPGQTVWARYYEPGTTTPIFGDRDRTIHYALAELSIERRAGYNWYGTWPADALTRYQDWQRDVSGQR